MTRQRPPRVLVVDDEADLRWVLCTLLQGAGFEVREAADGHEGLALARAWRPQLLLTDIRMPGQGGLKLIEELRRFDPALPVLVLSAVDEVDTAVAAMKRGACDYVVKPFDNETLVARIEQILAAAPPMRTGQSTRPSLFLGVSKSARALEDEVLRVAPTELTVLIEGESGTGKEYLARALHDLSPHATGPFVAVDCGALPKGLTESLLFGHRRGAFTGAEGDQEGLFTAAASGTLFLDEVGNLPAETQPKLLRALQERAVLPLGSGKTVPFQARILCASNLDLDAAAKEGTFRLDLFHRINEYRIRIPALRTRPEDVESFARLFLEREGRPGQEWLPEALACLGSRHWPGNLRELHNLVRRALVLAGPGPLGSEHLDPFPQAGSSQAASPASPFAPSGTLAEEVRRATDRLERDWIRQALEQARGNKAEAARILKVDYTTLHRKLKRHGMDESV